MLIKGDKRVIDQYQVVEVISDKEKGSVAIVYNPIKAKMAVRKQINSNKVELYQKLCNINNYNLPEIYHLFYDEESITIIEEFIEGNMLEDLIQSQSHINELEFISMMIQLCNALSELHNEDPPIIHRDIKPKNILYTEEQRLVLIDFDASREYKRDTDKDTRYLGTMEYAPPEQFGHSQTDARSDIYSIGMTMNELIKNGLVELLHGDGIQSIIDKCTMFDPNKRYQNIKELEKDLRQIHNNREEKRRVGRITASFASGLTMIAVVGFFLMKANNLINDNFEDNNQTKHNNSSISNIQGDISDFSLSSVKDNMISDKGTGGNVDDGKYINQSDEIIIDNAVIENSHIDFYKHETYMDDLKIYINYNDASQITYLSLTNYGRISEEHYYTDGNLLIVKKDYLNTLPSFYYELSIGFDKGNPANMVFEIHNEEEESVYGEFRLSHYSKKYYTSSPSDFILLVYGTNGAKIQGLYHGKEKIDSKYYKLEDNGIVAILDKSYMRDMDIGTIFELGIELDNGIRNKLSVQILERPIQQGLLEIYYFHYSISNPEDVLIEITWNDSKEVTRFLPVAEKDPKITDEQYTIDGNILRISRDALEGVDPGDYEWALVYDTGGESMFRITVIE